MARATVGRGLDRQQNGAVAQAFDWTFGPRAAGFYAAAAEAWPFARVGYGLGFAAVLWALTHESALPFLGLSDPPNRATARERFSELFTHGRYAVTVAFTRRAIRRRQA